jgi:excisionase family DNA binding protein
VRTHNEESFMTTTAILQRRLMRVKEAAAYLSMSGWKLRRLIQEGTFPVVQDYEGGTFLLDIGHLDSYTENHKRSIPDDYSPHVSFPVTAVATHTRNGSRRAERDAPFFTSLCLGHRH